MKKEVFNIEDLVVADLIAAEENVVVGHSAYVKGNTIAGGKNNIFINVGNNKYFSTETFKYYEALAYGTQLGTVGLKEESVTTFKHKFKKALKAQGIKKLELTVEEIAKLQDSISKISGDNEMDYAYCFGKFIKEREENQEVEQEDFEEYEPEEDVIQAEPDYEGE